MVLYSRFNRIEYSFLASNIQLMIGLYILCIMTMIVLFMVELISLAYRGLLSLNNYIKYALFICSYVYS